MSRRRLDNECSDKIRRRDEDYKREKPKEEDPLKHEPHPGAIIERIYDNFKYNPHDSNSTYPIWRYESVSLGLEEPILVNEEKNPNRQILKNSQPRFKGICPASHSYGSKTGIISIIRLGAPLIRGHLTRSTSTGGEIR